MASAKPSAGSMGALKGVFDASSRVPTPAPDSKHGDAQPGILAVYSDAIPSSGLTEETFDEWYTSDHIPMIMSLSGVKAAARYKFVPSRPTPSRDLKYLTIYELDDIEFLESKELAEKLKNDAQGPNGEKIYSKAILDKRAYLTVQKDEAEKAKAGPASLLLVASMSHPSDIELNKWYRGEHIPTIATSPGYRRTHRYQCLKRNITTAFSPPTGKDINDEAGAPMPKWAAMYDFEGDEDGEMGEDSWEGCRKANATPWSKKIDSEAEEQEVALWSLQGVWGKNGRLL